MSAIVKSNGASALAVSGAVHLNGVGDVFRLADVLAEARGFVPDSYVGKPQAIAACMLMGIELGIGPMEALRSIHVIKGKPSMGADMMLARAIRAGVRHEWVEKSATAAKLRLEREGFKPHIESFTIDDAKTAGLTSSDNWKKYPAAMLRARCVSAAMRAYCPDVLGASVYVPEELEAVARGPVATVVEMPALPAGEHIDAETGEVTASGEAGCGLTTGYSGDAPLKLSECGDEIQLGAWLRHNGRKVRKNTKALEKVLLRADEIGIGDAATWVDGVLAEVA